MKFNSTFIVAIIALMVVMLLFETNAPSSFKWDDHSQSYLSRQPFGCYVMDSVLRASLPQGYKVIGPDDTVLIDATFNGEKCTFLITQTEYQYTTLSDEEILELVKQGNNVILATTYNALSDELSESLDVSCHWTDRRYLSQDALSDNVNDTINWCPDDLFPEATYIVQSAFVDGELDLTNAYHPLAMLHSGDNSSQYYNEDVTAIFPVAAIRNYGRGKVIVMSMPKLFTNYGILDDSIRPFLLRLLSECGDLPVMRFDITAVHNDDKTETDSMQDSGSPLRYLLANRPLRWAFYLALATLVAFVICTARRRQRVIPVMLPPKNHMMDFVKRIGGIYYQRHDNVDLIIKKYVMFASDVRARTMIDIDDYDKIDDELQALSSRTGIPFDELRQQILDVWSATNASSISDERLKQLIDSMNNILHKINI